MNPFYLLAISAAGLVFMFLFTWRLSLSGDNFSFVDVTWAFSFAPVAMLYAFLGEGWMPRRYAVGVLVALWSLRLGTHLWSRVAHHHPAEDPRYAVLRRDWQGNLPRAFLWFFMAQALLVWLLMLPVWLISGYAAPGFTTWEWVGLSLWILGLCGESLADSQLKRFKAQNAGREKVCRAGLWRYSRHPNYFFQSLLWWGLFLMALPVPWGWTAILAPLAMLFFLLRVTGIPLTEELSVESKGEAYLDYQKTTSAFLPLPPKSKSH